MVATGQAVGDRRRLALHLEQDLAMLVGLPAMGAKAPCWVLTRTAEVISSQAALRSVARTIFSNISYSFMAVRFYGS